jgi:hypothetical protein
MVNVARLCSRVLRSGAVMRLRVEGPVVILCRQKHLVIRPWLTSIDNFGLGDHGVPGGYEQILSSDRHKRRVRRSGRTCITVHAMYDGMSLDRPTAYARELGGTTEWSSMSSEKP